jgi:hypothetical protein
MAVMEVPGKNHSVCPTILIMCISILDWIVCSAVPHCHCSPQKKAVRTNLSGNGKRCIDRKEVNSLILVSQTIPIWTEKSFSITSLVAMRSPDHVTNCMIGQHRTEQWWQMVEHVRNSHPVL